MAPLLPSESTIYTLTLPPEVEDDRKNLKIRTGAASTYTNSSVVIHGGLTTGLSLKSITIPDIREQLSALQNQKLSEVISNEFFYLNIINRQWTRLQLNPSQIKPKPRFYHSLAFHLSSIYLFGGLTIGEDTEELVPVNDLWEFNIESLEWSCLDDGLTSGTVARFDHTLAVARYVSPYDGEERVSLVIAGGRGELNQGLNHIVIFDLGEKKYIPNTEMGLSLNEAGNQRSTSTSSSVDPKSEDSEASKKKMKAMSESSLIIPSDVNCDESGNILYILSPQQRHNSSEIVTNPLVALPVAPHATGVRMSLSDVAKNKASIIPHNLRYPSGGIFGSNIIVSGFNESLNEFQVFLFNKPSQKWTRLNIDSKKRASELYLWRAFSWPSHHKVVVLGSASVPNDSEFNTIQAFDLLVLVGMPITNIFHSFSHSSAENQESAENSPSKSVPVKVTSSFEEYSKYISPSTKISSNRSVFPNYAVTLGRNAFERYGSSLSDFEFITADGDKVHVPLMLLRKRWGRCFDMLLAKGYSRAIYILESKTDCDDDDNNEESADTYSLKSGISSKRSVAIINKAQQQSDRDVPHFRLPFQDGQNAASVPSFSPIVAPTSSGGPTSRKASVVSTGNLSITSTSTAGSPGLDFDNIPTQSPFPNEPLPTLDSKQSLSSFGSKDYLRDSPRGSVSGNSIANIATAISFKDLRTSITSKRRGIRTSSVQTNQTDDTAVAEGGSNLGSIAHEIEDETATLLEPLLIPRSLYLPFSTATVQAFSEFLFTGQLGDKWLLTPTATDTFLMAKFYELPLLYDLISEVFYAIIGKKEDALIKDFGKMVLDYYARVKDLFNNDETLIKEFYDSHPHVEQAFRDIEDDLNTVDDGYLSFSLLRRASKTSFASSTPVSSKNSVDHSSGRRGSLKSPGRTGKSSLSKEINTVGSYEDSGDDVFDDEFDEHEDDDENDEADSKDVSSDNASSHSNSKNTFSPQFKTGTILHKSKGTSEDDDNLDPITPLNRKPVSTKSIQSDESLGLDSDDLKAIEETEVIDGRNHTLISGVLDDDDPLSHSGSGSAVKMSDYDYNVDPLEKSSSQTNTRERAADFQVPEGRFKIAKGMTYKRESGTDSEKVKESTASDSDDMALGLGLVTDVKLDNKKSNSDDPSDDANTEANNLPTLENLASPDTPTPGDHLLQIIYEVSALACDMKLLLRSMNVLELSKSLESKNNSILTELADFSKQYKESHSRLDTDGALKDNSVVDEAQKVESTESQNVAKIPDIPVKSAVPKSTRNSIEVKPAKNKPVDIIPHSSGQRSSISPSLSNKDEHDRKDVSTKGFSKRSTLASIRSFSSINLSKSGNRKETVSSESTSKYSVKNPFSRKKDEDGHKKSIIFSLIPKKSGSKP